MLGLLSSATVTPPALGDIVNTGIIDTLKDVYVHLTSLFTIFPVNLFLGLTVISISVSLISKVVSSFRAAN